MKQEVGAATGRFLLSTRPRAIRVAVVTSYVRGGQQEAGGDVRLVNAAAQQGCRLDRVLSAA
jgi:hypothetical protein